MINLEDPDWEPTAVGRPYSYKYGFGVLDAHKYVTAAQAWKLVKPQAWFQTKTIQLEGGTMNKDQQYSGGQFIGPDGVTSTVSITKQLLVDSNFETLEHVNIKVWINHTARGDVEVELVSPNGIKSILAKKRQLDRASTGFPGWTFMSVKHWYVYAYFPYVFSLRLSQGRGSYRRLDNQSIRSKHPRIKQWDFPGMEHEVLGCLNRSFQGDEI